MTKTLPRAFTSPQPTKPSERQKFQKQVLIDLSTAAAQEQLLESWGSIHFSESLTFYSDFDEIVGFFPIYDKSHDRTQAVIFAVASDEYIKYSKVQRGTLLQIPFDNNNRHQPNLMAIARAFKVLDKKVFGLNADLGDIFG